MPNVLHIYRAKVNVGEGEDEESVQCLSCHLVTTSNQSETEVNLMLSRYTEDQGRRLQWEKYQVRKASTRNDNNAEQ